MMFGAYLVVLGSIIIIMLYHIKETKQAGAELGHAQFNLGLLVIMVELHYD